MPPETAHRVTLGVLKVLMALPGIPGLLRRLWAPPALLAENSRLRTRVGDLEFTHPVGLAAGFDKDGSSYAQLARLGFSHIEVGTITAHAQPGNPRPRLFRLPADQCLINRFGFNNPGAEAMARRLKHTDYHRPCIRGLNIGKSKITELEEAAEDYGHSARLLAGRGDYITINVSSPNTPGLRSLQTLDSLEKILALVRRGAGSDFPVCLKIAPDLDLSEVKQLARFCLQEKVWAIAIGNTTLRRQELGLRSRPEQYRETGGLSGPVLHEIACNLIGDVYQETRGQLPIIGIGGTWNGPTAWEKILHGASLLQVYTGYVYQGPSLPRRVNQYLDRQLRKHGLDNIGQAVGLLHRRGG